jgi:shikimate kinase
MKGRNLVLIGMPASGKSTVGVILAKELKYRFLDTDLLIQEQTDHTLTELIAAHGMKGFLALEEEALCGVQARRTVIATGGSAVYGERAMAHLREIGTIVYLRHRFEVIDSRLTNITTRGVVMAPGHMLYDLFLERTPLYERWADVTIDADGLTTEQTVQVIIRALQGR